MSRRTLTGLGFAVVAAMAAAACSAESPTAATADGDVPLGAKASAVAGSYQLSFVTSGLQPVTSLPVSSAELALKAHVAEAATGLPAQGGTVTFEYCSLKGGPPNDITRADEAPLEACASGDASWARLGSVTVNTSGDAYLNFGIVQIPRTVGFRFRYSGQRSGIASGVSAPANFTWVAAM